MSAVAKFPAEGLRDAVGVMAGCAGVGIGAGRVLTTGKAGPTLRMRILDLAVPALKEINRASDLPRLGVLCVVRGVDTVVGVTRSAPGVLAVPLISEPGSESS